MAYPGKTENQAYRKLVSDLKAGRRGRLYVFFGEESYLKDHYLGVLKQAVCGGFEDFNHVVIEGERLTADRLTDALYTLPMGGGKLVVVRDYKLMQPSGELKELLPGLLADLPEHVCLVFLFDALEFKPDKRLSIYKALDKHGSLVEFEPARQADLAVWLKRLFKARGKEIEAAACDRMLFLCGHHMTNLITEIDKIAAGAAGPCVTAADVDALASRVLEADVFALTRCALDGNCAKGLDILRDLFDMRHKPVAILGAIIHQLHQLYAARLVLEAEKGERLIMEVCGLRSSYQARMLLDGAQRLKLPFLRRAQQLCLDCDVELKSGISDDRRTIELLLLKLSAGAAA